MILGEGVESTNVTVDHEEEGVCHYITCSFFLEIFENWVKYVNRFIFQNVLFFYCIVNKSLDRPGEGPAKYHLKTFRGGGVGQNGQKCIT